MPNSSAIDYITQTTRGTYILRLMQSSDIFRTIRYLVLVVPDVASNEAL
jgi:hypothetical protein